MPFAYMLVNMHHQITMIDDNPLDHLIVKRICDSEGMFNQMEHLHHGGGFVESFTVNEHQPTRTPHILLLDLNMPGDNCWTLLKKLKNNYQRLGKQLDVYILSSSICPLDEERSRTYPFVKNFLVKPMTRLTMRSLYQAYCLG